MDDVYKELGGWYFKEGSDGAHGPFESEAAARTMLAAYRAAMSHIITIDPSAPSVKVIEANQPPPAVKRVPVNFRYDCINPTFLKMLARIGHYASEKYGSWEQYTQAPLEGEESCLNHVYEHLRQYVAGEAHDKFGDVRWHLAAAAYNLMMQFFYHSRFGAPPRHLLVTDDAKELLDGKASDPQ